MSVLHFSNYFVYHQTHIYHLYSFGGAGPQHGAYIAASLNIPRILVPRFSSVLSAYGMALADIITESSEPSSFELGTPSSQSTIVAKSDRLKASAIQSLREQGFEGSSIKIETFLNCRFAGSSTALMIEGHPSESDFGKLFIEMHKQLFGFVLEGREVVVDDVRIRATGQSDRNEECTLYRDWRESEMKVVDVGSWKTKKVFFEDKGWLDTPVIELESLQSGNQIHVSPTFPLFLT